MIYTNQLAGNLSYAALSGDFQLGLLSAKGREDELGQQRKALLGMHVLSYTFIPGIGYLGVFKAGEVLRIPSATTFERLSFEERPADHIYANNILQLLLNLVSLEPVPLTDSNLSGYLYLTRGEWQFGRDKDGQFALEAKIDQAQTLELRVVSFFNEALMPKKGTHQASHWVWNRINNTIERYTGQRSSSSTILVRGNPSDRRNALSFLNFQELQGFESSKVGISKRLVDNLNLQFKRYIRTPFSFLAMPEVAHIRRKLPKVDTTWAQFAGQTLNIYPASDEALCSELAKRLADVMKASETLKQLRVEIALTATAQSGFNLQVVRDARANETISEQYEPASRDQVIQHVTVENFGQLNPKGELEWPTFAYKTDENTGKSGHKQKDPAEQPEILKLAQELLIRKDLLDGKLNMVAPALLASASRFCFYRFTRLEPSKEDSKILVTSLKITPEGQLLFNQKQVNIAEREDHAHLAKVCGMVASQLGNSYLPSAWRFIECAFEIDGRLYFVRRLATTTLPNVEHLSELLAVTDPERKVNADLLVHCLNQLREQAGLDSDKIDQLLSILASEHGVVALGQIIEIIRKAGIQFRSKGWQAIAAAVQSQLGYTFFSSTRGADSAGMLSGLSEIRLLETLNSYAYTVGERQGLKTKIERAVHLREIRGVGAPQAAIPEFFSDFAQMLTVGFVRTGEYTVLPFPIKYLREYEDLILHQRKFAGRGTKS